MTKSPVSIQVTRLAFFVSPYVSYYVVMEFMQSLKAASQQIIELSDRLGDRVRTWDQEKLAPTGGYTDRAGFFIHNGIELYADVYASGHGTKSLLRARLAWAREDKAGQELFTIITLDFDAELEKTRSLITDSDNLTQERLISLLNDPTTTPKYIQVSLDSGKITDDDRVGTRYEFNSENLQEITEADQVELLSTVNKAYDQIVSKI